MRRYLLACLVFAFPACSHQASQTERPDFANRTGSGIVHPPIPFLVDSITPAELSRRVMQFAPAVLDFDDAALQPWEKQVLKKLVDASFVLHDIYAARSPRRFRNGARGSRASRARAKQRRSTISKSWSAPGIDSSLMRRFSKLGPGPRARPSIHPT